MAWYGGIVVWYDSVVVWHGGMIVWWYGGHFIAVWTENGLVSVANPGEARFFNALFKPELVAVLRVVDPGGCGILLETPYILSFLEEFSRVYFSPATPPLVASCYAVLPKVICVCTMYNMQCVYIPNLHEYILHPRPHWCSV